MWSCPRDLGMKGRGRARGVGAGGCWWLSARAHSTCVPRWASSGQCAQAHRPRPVRGGVPMVGRVAGRAPAAVPLARGVAGNDRSSPGALPVAYRCVHGDSDGPMGAWDCRFWRVFYLLIKHTLRFTNTETLQVRVALIGVDVW